MITTDKIWGTTTALVSTPMFEMHRLFIKPWHRCSLHSHKTKHNAFFVISGCLHIDGGKPELDDPIWRPHELVTLRQGDCWTVAPGVWHQFRTGYDACVALEMYYTEPLSEDIIRYNTGGPV